jgi:hypothetical protein
MTTRRPKISASSSSSGFNRDGDGYATRSEFEEVHQPDVHT